MPTLTPDRTDAPVGKVTIAVTGMTCAACSARVQRALQRTPGVKDAVVNLMTNSATVAFDRTIASPDSLVETVRATGYHATCTGKRQTGAFRVKVAGRGTRTFQDGYAKACWIATSRKGLHFDDIQSACNGLTVATAK